MKAKEFLERAYRQKLRVESIQMQVELIRSSAEQTGSIQYGERVSHTRNVTAMEDAVIRLMAEEEKLKNASGTLIRFQAENAELINTLDDSRQRAVLTRRYIGFETWERIAENMHYSTRWVLKQHVIALKKLDQKEEIIDGILGSNGR